MPCGRAGQPACTTCDIFVLASNIINFVIFTLVPAIAVLLYLWAGFMILMGGANPGWIATGTGIFKTTTWGLVIVFTSWMITNTVLKSLAGDSIFTKDWNKVTCTAGLGQPPPPTVLADACSNPQQLAQQNNEPYPRTNDPELDRLMTCIRSEMRTANLGEVSTYDRTYELCNYTRGQRTACTPSCSHAVNSCHYGGATGRNGALAVDYGNEQIGDQVIAAALRCGAKNGRCESSSGQTVACTNSSANHVHINSRSCDRN